MFNTESKEYLARLLSFQNAANAEKNAEALADRFDDLNYLLHIDEFTLNEVSGYDENTAGYIRLVAALTSRRITDKFKNGKKYLQNEIKEYIVGLFFGLTVETVYLIMFDKNDKLISAEYLGDGTVNSSGFLPRKLLDVVLRKKAKSVILSHNHPCGRSEPSKNDIATTYLAKTVLGDAGVELLHHYIVSGFDIEDCLGSTLEGAKEPGKYLNVSTDNGKNI